MNRLKPIHSLVLLAIFFTACRNQEKYPYAIRDFRAGLRPYLAAIVTTGIVGYDSASYFVRQHATDGELLQLSRAECPILRATALRGIAERKSMDNFTVLMSHLDDTATIAYDDGEWGTKFAMVTDDFIDNSKWKTIEEKNKTINAVIMQHNYLRSAYYILYKPDAVPKYYPYIKKMVLAEKPFEDIEEALFALARYKKKDDIVFIRQFLLEQPHNWRMGLFSFRLMDEYPDTSYLEVLGYYAKKNFYRQISNIDNVRRFFETLAGYKNKKSAEILMRIMNRKPFVNQGVDSSNLRSMLNDAIFDNKCEAYSKLEEQIRPYIPELIRDRMPIDSNQQFLISRPETDFW